MNNNPSAHVVGIVESQSIAYIQAVFAALSAGETVVPLRSKNDETRIELAGVKEVRIVSETHRGDKGEFFRPLLSVSNVKTPAYVSFTSGTEGSPKAVFISASALNNTVERLQVVMQMDSGVKEYIGVPVYHSFGFGRCRHVAAVGGSCYIPENGFDPRELSVLLARKQVNSLSLVPSLLRILIQSPNLLGDERHLLLWLEIGSQVMTAEEKKAVMALFPNAKIVQHYGLTEASRSTLLQMDGATDDALNSVGRCYGDSEVRINDSGRICIRGAHLASYIQKKHEQLTLIDSDGWCETSYLGRLGGGYLYFLGRADNLVNCGGQKLSTEALEMAITAKLTANQLSRLHIAVSRIDNPVYGEGFLLSCSSLDCSESGKNNAPEIIKPIAAACLADLGLSAKNAIAYQWVNGLPKTATGKVLHRELVKQYSEKNALSQNEVAGCHAVVDHKKQLVMNISHILGLSCEAINLNDSISDVGVDSLQTVRLSIVLDTTLGYLPADWRNQSLAELINLAPDVSSTNNTSAPTSPADSNAQNQSQSKKASALWDGSSNRNPSDITFLSLIKEDYVTHDRDFFSQGLFALFVNRFGNWRMSIRTKILRFPMSILYRVLRKMAQVFCGIKLDYTVQVGRRVKLEHFGGMILGAKKIGDDTIIRQNTTFGIRDISDLSAKPIIEKGVNIGAGVVIVGDVVIGRHSVIGPNCVVSESVPAFSVVTVQQPTVLVTSAEKTASH